MLWMLWIHGGGYLEKKMKGERRVNCSPTHFDFHFFIQLDTFIVFYITCAALFVCVLFPVSLLFSPRIWLSVYLYFLLFIWTFLQFLFLATITASIYAMCDILPQLDLPQTQLNSTSARVRLMLPLLCALCFSFYAFSTS